MSGHSPTAVLMSPQGGRTLIDPYSSLYMSALEDLATLRICVHCILRRAAASGQDAAGLMLMINAVGQARGIQRDLQPLVLEVKEVRPRPRACV
jgi:hypothetical protein